MPDTSIRLINITDQNPVDHKYVDMGDDTHAAAVAIVGFAAAGAHAQEKLKVGFIYVGPANDGGWTQRHDIGRQELTRQHWIDGR